LCFDPLPQGRIRLDIRTRPERVTLDLLGFLDLVTRQVIIKEQATTSIPTLAGLKFTSESVGNVLQRARYRVGRRAKPLADDQGRQVPLRAREGQQLVTLQIVVDQVVQSNFVRRWLE